MITYQVEDYLSAIGEMRVLYRLHWKEIALDQDCITLDVDYELYAVMAKANSLHLVTAREDGVLVGYHLSFLRHHMHYKSTLHAYTDIFYLLPDYRDGWAGYYLIKKFLETVKERGVKKAIMGCKLHKDLDPIMKRLKMEPIERVYSKVFK